MVQSRGGDECGGGHRVRNSLHTYYRGAVAEGSAEGGTDAKRCKMNQPSVLVAP